MYKRLGQQCVKGWRTSSLLPTSQILASYSREKIFIDKSNIKIADKKNLLKIPTNNVEEIHQNAFKASANIPVAQGRVSVFDPESTRPPLLRKPQATVLKFDGSGETTELIDLPPYLFDCKPRKDVLHAVVTWQLACRRQGTHKVKNRYETAYSKRKIYRQKGTGRARHGDRGAPQFRGGGRAFGKVPKDYSYKLNRKLRRLAFRMALTRAYLANDLIIVDDIKTPFEDIPKTRIMWRCLKGIDCTKPEHRPLIVDDTFHTNTEKSLFRMKFTHYTSVAGLNVYDMLLKKKIVLSRPALNQLISHYEQYFHEI